MFRSQRTQNRNMSNQIDSLHSYIQRFNKRINMFRMKQKQIAKNIISFEAVFFLKKKRERNKRFLKILLYKLSSYASKFFQIYLSLLFLQDKLLVDTSGEQLSLQPARHVAQYLWGKCKPDTSLTRVY